MKNLMATTARGKDVDMPMTENKNKQDGQQWQTRCKTMGRRAEG